MEFERSRVDGVPVFWTESGDEMLAGLVFRVGRADESLARGGITHLVEHLALYPLGVDGGKHYNGQVDAVTTTFVRRGRPEEIAEFFRAVCVNLRDLPTERLEREKQVLRTEAGGRRPGMTGPLFIERYGADTYGLPSYREYGINARAGAGGGLVRAGGPQPRGPDVHRHPRPPAAAGVAA